MLTFLKKLGQVLTIVGRVAGFLPLIEPALSTGVQNAITPIADKLQSALGVITTAEQMFGAAFGPTAKNGSDKLRAATPYISQLIQNTDLLIGKKPKDEAGFTAGVTNLTSALADILNAYGD